MAHQFKRTSLLFLAIVLLTFGVSKQAAAQTSDNEILTGTEAPQLAATSSEDLGCYSETINVSWPADGSVVRASNIATATGVTAVGWGNSQGIASSPSAFTTYTTGSIASNEATACTAGGAPTAITLNSIGTESGQSPLQIILIAGALMATVLVLLVTLRDQEML